MSEQLLTLVFAGLQVITVALVCFIAKFVMSTSNSITQLVAWSAGHEELDKARFQAMHDRLERPSK